MTRMKSTIFTRTICNPCPVRFICRPFLTNLRVISFEICRVNSHYIRNSINRRTNCECTHESTCQPTPGPGANPPDYYEFLELTGRLHLCQAGHSRFTEVRT